MKQKKIIYLFNNVHAIHDLTKNNMPPIQPFSLYCKEVFASNLLGKQNTCANEKLAAISMRSCICHGQDARTLESVKQVSHRFVLCNKTYSVPQLEVFVLELSPINAFTT